jgi:hypothetical protein
MCPQYRNRQHLRAYLYRGFFIAILFLMGIAGPAAAIEFAYFIEPEPEPSPQPFRATLSPDVGMSGLGLEAALTLALTMPNGAALRAQTFHMGDKGEENYMTGEALTVGYSYRPHWGWVDGGVGALWAKTRHSDTYSYFEYRNGYGYTAHVEAVRAFHFVGVGLALDWRMMPGNFSLTSASLLIPIGRMH